MQSLPFAVTTVSCPVAKFSSSAVGSTNRISLEIKNYINDFKSNTLQKVLQVANDISMCTFCIVICIGLDYSQMFYGNKSILFNLICVAIGHHWRKFITGCPTYSSNIAYVEDTGLHCNTSAVGRSGKASTLSVSSFRLTSGKVALNENRENIVPSMDSI